MALSMDNNENPLTGWDFTSLFSSYQLRQHKQLTFLQMLSGQCRSLWRGEETPSLSALLALISAQS